MVRERGLEGIFDSPEDLTALRPVLVTMSSLYGLCQLPASMLYYPRHPGDLTARPFQSTRLPALYGRWSLPTSAGCSPCEVVAGNLEERPLPSDGVPGAGTAAGRLFAPTSDIRQLQDYKTSVPSRETHG